MLYIQALYDGAVNEKQSLLDDAESCRRKMSSAMALIDGLSGEKVNLCTNFFFRIMESTNG